MKQHIVDLLSQAVTSLQNEQRLAADLNIDIQVERARDKSQGDFASNIAMMLAKPAGMKPRDLAEMVVAALPATEQVADVNIAGPGFINFKLSDAALHNVVAEVLKQSVCYGLQPETAQRVLIEFVSANPTGPLHVGHGRHAAYGSSLANLLKAAGWQVHSEYYVNDAGRQMNILAISVWLRYLQACNQTLTFPSNGYKGDYVNDIAAQLKATHGDKFVHTTATVFADIPADEPQGGDKEQHVDALINKAYDLLGKEGFRTVHSAGLDAILLDIKEDLAEFRVEFDEWFSERSVVESGAVQRAIDKLTAAGHTFEQEGALWFNAVHFGDEKDRVLVRANGQTTYFASDVAYHMQKFERGFDRAIDILGADHHGYVARVRASLQALGQDPTDLDVFLVQFAILYRGDERVQMSTRSGSFVTLRSLRDEVGNDAARYFYVMRKADQHMDFDLKLAVSKSNENPVYYIQYAHARICSVFRSAKEKNIEWDQLLGLQSLQLLQESHEQELLTGLIQYPELIKSAGRACEPHQLAIYLRELANKFHTYYNAHQFIVDDAALRNARMCLIVAVRQVLVNGLTIIGVSAPEEM